MVPPGYRALWLERLVSLQYIDEEYLRVWEQFITTLAVHEWVALMIARHPDRHQIMSQVNLPGAILNKFHTPMPSFKRLQRLVPCDELQHGAKLYRAMIFSEQTHVDVDGARAMVARVIDSLISPEDERAFLQEASLCFMMVTRKWCLTVKWSHARNCRCCRLAIRQQISLELTLRAVCKSRVCIMRSICDMLDCREPTRW